MADLLLEIGVEELPARFVRIALDQIRDSFREILEKNGLLKPDVHIECWGTPRRLVLFASGLPPKTPDQYRQQIGPPWEKAFSNGSPTPQALGFAQRVGVPVESLKRIETPRGVFAGVEIVETGRLTRDLLKEELVSLLAKVHFPKTMRWQEGGFSFARPIRWLLGLWEDEPISLEVGGIPSSRVSTGPRFSPRPVSIPHAKDYRERMRRAGVIVSPEERRDHIKKRARLIAEKNSLEILWDEELLEEIVFLTEWPEPQLGSFDPRYLRLPEIVIQTVLRDHQRCFIVRDRNHHLAPYFLFVMNRRNDPGGVVRKGNERVVRARLEDAWFYFCEDLGIPVDSREIQARENCFTRMELALKGMIFLEGLGTMAERKKRIRELSLQLFALLPQESPPSLEEKEILERASDLYLNDLGSKMVYEYPELAGKMTPIYARLSGAVSIPQGEAILLALEEANLPEDERSSLPQTVPGYLLALSQRLDNLFSHAFLQHFPSGTHDPFGMKTVADEMIILLLSPPQEIVPYVARWSYRVVDSLFTEWLKNIKESSGVVPREHSGDEEAISRKLFSFLRERLESILVQKGFPTPWVRGVVDTLHFQPLTAFRRLSALQEWGQSHDLVRFLDTYKRFRNIARDVESAFSSFPFPNLSEKTEAFEPVEREFVEILARSEITLKELIESDPHRALDLLWDLVPRAEELFRGVRIEHPDPEIRGRRKIIVAFARFLFLQYLNWDRLLEG